MKYSLLCFCIVIVYSCKHIEHVMSRNDATQGNDSAGLSLLNADKSWSERAAQKGYYHSRSDFASDSAIDMLEGEMPLYGRKAIEQYALTQADSALTMNWKPLRYGVAASGELGYTFGAWTMHTKTKQQKDTVLYGDYITVWKKNTDRTWKYVVDGGNTTPKPVEQ